MNCHQQIFKANPQKISLMNNKVVSPPIKLPIHTSSSFFAWKTIPTQKLPNRLSVASSPPQLSLFINSRSHQSRLHFLPAVTSITWRDKRERHVKCECSHHNLQPYTIFSVINAAQPSFQSVTLCWYAIWKQNFGQQLGNAASQIRFSRLTVNGGSETRCSRNTWWMFAKASSQGFGHVPISRSYAVICSVFSRKSKTFARIAQNAF